METDEQKHVYIKEYESQEGVLLEADKIERNEALRSLAKLGLNSFWVSRTNNEHVASDVQYDHFRNNYHFRWLDDQMCSMVISGKIWSTVKYDTHVVLYERS